VKRLLAALINNVGSRLLGAIEETSVDEAKEAFETNFFGVHRVTRAALPVLRETGNARIVNVSSLVGLNAIPFGALYSASKWALEAYSEALRFEVKPLGFRSPSSSPPRSAPKQDRRHADRNPSPRTTVLGSARSRSFSKATEPASILPSSRHASFESSRAARPGCDIASARRLRGSRD
jgi:NAD(P)-dependent dehydrogenase (short-subunit alcohol dehydrogenase family)